MTKRLLVGAERDAGGHAVAVAHAQLRVRQVVLPSERTNEWVGGWVSEGESSEESSDQREREITTYLAFSKSKRYAARADTKSPSF